MKSKFIRLKCKCGQEKVIFSHSTTAIPCSGCNMVLAVPQGGEAALFGKVTKELG